MNCGPSLDQSDWSSPSHGEELRLTDGLVRGEGQSVPSASAGGSLACSFIFPMEKEVRKAKGIPVVVRAVIEADTGSGSRWRSSQPL